MNALKSWYSAAELLGLPGLPESRTGFLKKAKRENWHSRPREDRGGGQEYHFQSLPAETQQHLINVATPPVRANDDSPLPIPAPPAPEQPLATVDPKPVTQLKRYQRETMIARQGILNELDRMSRVLGRTRAVNVLCEMTAAGTLPAALRDRLPLALGKRKGAGRLSPATLWRWLAARDRGEVALAPKDMPLHSAPPWWPLFLKFFQRPQNVTLAWAHEQMAKTLPAEDCPTLSQVYRESRRMGAVECLKGRMGSRALANHRPFTRRGTEELWPTAVYEMDGHTFDAEVAHFMHGGAFRPEITTCADVATRRVVGWSVALSESAWAVLDALRHACCTGGIPWIFYVDNGSGYKNAVMTAEATGLIDRLKIELKHTRPYSPQGHGLIERINQSLWVRAAKELPTYMGRDMDPEAKQRVYKRTRKDLATAGVSALLPSWSWFMAFAEQKVADYNHRPHGGLPEITDPVTGKRRHQTPMEAWDEGIAEGSAVGVVFDTVEPALADSLFRPYVFRRVLRGEVVIGKNLYFDKRLEEYNGHQVMIGYDIHDAGRVWVYDINYALICVARFEANKRSYFPVSEIEEAAARRAKHRAARLERQLDEVSDELNGGRTPIEPEPLDPVQAAEIDAMLDRHALEQQDDRDDTFARVTRIGSPAAGDRPVFRDEFDFYAWVIAKPRAQLSDDDQRHLTALEKDAAFMTTWREVYQEDNQ